MQLKKGTDLWGGGIVTKENAEISHQQAASFACSLYYADTRPELNEAGEWEFSGIPIAELIAGMKNSIEAIENVGFTVLNTHILEVLEAAVSILSRYDGPPSSKNLDQLLAVATAISCGDLVPESTENGYFLQGVHVGEWIDVFIEAVEERGYFDGFSCVNHANKVIFRKAIAALTRVNIDPRELIADDLLSFACDVNTGFLTNYGYDKFEILGHPVWVWTTEFQRAINGYAVASMESSTGAPMDTKGAIKILQRAIEELESGTRS